MRWLTGLTLGIAAVPMVQADNVYYENPTPDSDWFTGTNWSTGSIPTSADNAIIDGDYSSLITSGSTTVDQVYLGNFGGTSGSLTITGAGAGLTANNQILIGNGDSGTSSMVISNGATVSAFSTEVGFVSMGNLTVTGPGSTFTVTSTNYGAALTLTTGTLAVTNGGQVSTASTLTMSGFGTGAAVVVSGSGSTLTSASDFIMGGDGTFDVNNGGRVTIGGAATFGSANGIAVTVSGSNSAIIQTGSLSNFYIGDAGQFGGIGSLAVTNSGTVSVSGFALGTSGSNAIGVATISGTGSALIASFGVFVGDVGTGTLTLSNGAKLTNVTNNGQNIIGRTKNTGKGAVIVTGTGSVWDTNTLSLTVASGSNTVGTLRVDDGGVVTTEGGGLFIASSTGAQGTVTQTSGTLIAGSVRMGRGTSIYHLEGGVLQVGGANAIQATGTYTLDWAGGTIQTSGVFTSTLNAVLKAGTLSSYDSNGFSGTWSGSLSGSGGLNKIGNGTLAITGINTYTGGSTLTSGTLSVGNNTSLGTGTMTFAGNSTLQSITTSRLLANNITINNGVSGTIGGTTGITLSGTISGGGALAMVSTSTLVLSGTNTYTGGTTISSGLIRFSSTNNFGTGQISMTGGGLQWASGNTDDVSSRVVLSSGSGTFDTNGANVIFATSLTGAGGLTKAGTGTLTLSASNAYTGNTTTSGGTLLIANRDALANTGTISLSGGQLSGTGTVSPLAAPVLLAATSTIGGSANLTLSGSVTNTQAGNPTLAIASTGSTTFSGNLALSSNNTARTVTINTTGGPVLVSGTIGNGGTGGGGLTKTGSGTLALTAANTYSGTTTISAGVLSFGAGSLGTGALSMNGGELRWASGNTTTLTKTIALSSAATFNTNGNNVTVSGTMSGSGVFMKTGDGVLTLSGTSTATSGTNSVLGGTLRLGANGALATSKLIISSLTNGGTATLDLNGYNLTASQLTFNGSPNNLSANRTTNNLMTGSGTLTLGGNVYYWYGTGDESTDPLTSTISGNLALGSATRIFSIAHSAQVTGPELVVDAVVSGAGGITKGNIYDGTLALNGANTYTGTTTVSSGILAVKILANGGQASSVGASSSAATNLILNSGTLQYTGTGGSTDRLFTFGDAVNSGTTSGLDASGSGAIAFTNTGSVTSFANHSAILVLSGTNMGNNTLAAAVSDNFFTSNSLVKNGIGKWVLTGSNSYAGGTTLNGGVLGLGSVSALSGTGIITMNGGTMQYSAANNTDYSARFSTGTSQQYNIDTNGQSVTYASSLSSVGGSLGKYGAGTLTLSGSNSYDGGTLVKSGTLVASNNSAVGTGAVTVDGGVFLVDTNATVTNSVTVNSGTYARSITGNIAGAVNATSNISGGVNTTVALLAGTVSNPTTLVTAFAATSSATNDFLRRSDVYSFQGTGTDVFALQLSFTATSPDSYLGWLSGNQWINAVDGNTGNNATLAQQGFIGDFAAFQALYGTDLSLYIGAYGTYVNGGVTESWAVLNHNSDYAVIPEPGTTALLGVAFGFTLFVLRRRRN